MTDQQPTEEKEREMVIIRDLGREGITKGAFRDPRPYKARFRGRLRSEDPEHND